MTQPASMGSQARLSMAAPGTAIASYTESCEFVGESLAKQLTMLDTAGIRGTRSHPAERTRDGAYAVRGTIRFHCSKGLLDLLLPRILGGGASPTWTLAETLPAFDVLIDRVASRFAYGTCKVNRAVFRARASGLLELALDIIGETETVSATPFPAIAAPTDAPYIWQDCVVTLNAAARVVTEFELVVDNHVRARFSNSQTATDLYPTDRTIGLKCTVPFTGDDTDLYGANTGAAAAGTLVFTNGPHSLTFSLPLVQFPDNSPVVADKGEIFLRLDGTAKRVGTNAELVVTNN
ncbi:MAG: phage tail tube protein [Deltaproteobacteria bacterium]